MLRHAADRRSLGLAMVHLALAGVVLWLRAWYLVPVLACLSSGYLPALCLA